MMFERFGSAFEWRFDLAEGAVHCGATFDEKARPSSDSRYKPRTKTIFR